jgi:hypothetical protein
MICYISSLIVDAIFKSSYHLKTKVMKPIIKRFKLLMAILLLTSYISTAQNANATNNATTTNTTQMKTYLIEREIPGAGQFSGEKLKAISQTSCAVLKELGPKIQWIQSYVTGNKIYCIYKAENADLIREHAKKGGFPANSIVEISSVISPATAN